MNSENNTQQVQKDETSSKKQPLPSRSEVQRNRKKGMKKKRKLKFPLMNFLVFFFILMLLGIFIFATYIDKESFLLFSSSDATHNNVQAVEVKRNEKISEPITTETATKSTTEIENTSKDEVSSEPAVEVDEEVEAEKPAEVEEPEEPATVVEQVDTKELEQKATESTSTTNSEEDEYRIVTHTVQAKETVYRISMNYYQSSDGIELIRKWNNLTGDDIRVGQVLKIPLKK